MINRFLNIFRRQVAAPVTVKVDDSPGWGFLSNRPHDYDQAQIQEIYSDALTAWRKNPIAWRIIAIISDYVVGDQITLTSKEKRLDDYIKRFWNHPKNNMELRLETMCEELARSGDLFVILFSTQDGLSFVRFVTKDQIVKIETSEKDWETEIAYYEQSNIGEPKRWLSKDHPDAENQTEIMIHYSVNRPLGALLGESDLTTMLPWLQRYSRMLEDRVRLHWAIRSFLWMVTVPTSKVAEKQEQYRNPPETGSIIVKDEGESWEAVNPQMRSAEAEHDLRAVRGMIDAGSGFPPHWRGEAADANLATATAMQAPTERHLLRRQKHFAWMLKDIIITSYVRAVEQNIEKPIKGDLYGLIEVSKPDISRTDNESLARSARDISQAMQALLNMTGNSPGLYKRAISNILKFAGEPISLTELEDEWQPPVDKKQSQPQEQQSD